MRDRLLPVLIMTIMAVTKPALAGDTPSGKGTAPLKVAMASGSGETQTAAVMPGIGRESRLAQPPRPLSASDAAAYGRVFKLQADGQWAAADREMAKISDDLLRGHVLAQRYRSAMYRPKYPELRAWMADYADLPQSETLHQMATAKGMKGFGAVKPPVRGALKGTIVDISDEGANWETDSYLSDDDSPKVRSLKSKFRALLRKGNGSAALALLTSSEARPLDRLDVDGMKALVAADHFAGGRDAEAAAWASQVAERSGDELPIAHWVAGMALWRLGKVEDARVHFEDVAQADKASPWMVSGAAYWAARANLVSRRPEVYNHWMEIAATYPRTFYGMVARQQMGYETSFSWDAAPFTEADADLLTRAPGTRRALALLQLGRASDAEEELRKIYPRATKPLRHSMMVLAQVGGMPGLALRLGGMSGSNGLSDAAAFPMPEWNPRGGWQVDKALVYAITRQESAFNPNCKSDSGATGLMQIMPATAAEIAGPSARERLTDPEHNLGLGQRYIQKLLGEDPVRGNLIYMAAAYNAGPGKLNIWMSGMNPKVSQDPLLFIESLPSRETRSFVQRVLTNYWIYRSRMGQPSGTLETIASGQWPFYDGMEPVSSKRGKANRI